MTEQKVEPSFATRDSATISRPAGAFRADINGLRAVAVMAVISYHFDLLPVYGGFAGVDIFFVISGYLITRIICKDVDTGSFRLANFYAARVRRIVPALTVLCALVMLFGFIAVDPISYEDMARAAIASLLFVSNFTDLLQTDYFGPAATTNWFLHSWSLSVEWQFYLIYPLVLIYALRAPLVRRHLEAIFGVTLLLSLLFCFLVSHDAPKFAFYLLPGRAWEFLAGGLVARRDGLKTLQPRLRWILHYAGLASIIFCVCRVDGFTSWPSLSTVLPVAGTAAVIASNHSRPRWATNVAVRNLGFWSYSLYLWHWPFNVGLHYLYERPSAWQIGLALAGTVGMAALSFYWVEQPALRGFRALSRRRELLPRLILAVLFTATIFGAVVVNGYAGFDGRVGMPGWLAPYRAALADNGFPAGCGGMTFRGTLRTCSIGEVATATPEHRVLVIGDSFAQQWYAGFEEFVGHHPDYAATFATYGGCPIIPTVARARPGFRCAAYTDAAYQDANSGQYGTVFIGMIGVPSFEPPYGKAGPNLDAVCFRTSMGCDMVNDIQTFKAKEDEAFAAFDAAIQHLRSRGVRVILMLPSPFGSIDIPRSMAETAFQNGGHADRLWIDAAQFNRRSADIRERLMLIANQTGAEIVDPRPITCGSSECATSDTNGTPLYIDAIHFRSSTVRRSGLIERVLEGRMSEQP